jgi:copper resistance protein D
MIPFLDIYTLLAVILRALALVFEALMIGGVIFRFVSVPEDCEHRLNASLTRMIRVSAALLALTAFVYLSINSALLMLSTNLRWRDLCGASFFVWGAVVIVGAGVCGACAQATRARALCSGGCILALVAAVMTSHSAARLDHRAILIGLTAAHHLAGAAWIGGLPYLLLALTRTSDPSACKTVLRRFSSTATIPWSSYWSPESPWVASMSGARPRSRVRPMA